MMMGESLRCVSVPPVIGNHGLSGKVRWKRTGNWGKFWEDDGGGGRRVHSKQERLNLGSVMPLWNLNYHFVWATYERFPLITSVREVTLYRWIKSRTHGLGGDLHAIGGIADHVHLIVSIPPSLAPSAYVKLIKGGSSRFVNLNHPDPNAKFKWQEEYGVFSISDRNLDHAIAYAQNQKQHHANGTIFPNIEPDALSSPRHP
jgi:putative transposase